MRRAIPNIPKNMERDLRRAQRAMSGYNDALARRNDLLVELSVAGIPQYRLAEILTEEATALGDKPLSEDAVQKAIRRTRERAA